MRAGYRLDAVGIDYSWDDLYAFTRYAGAESAIYRATQGHNWDVNTLLLAAAVDQNNMLLWLTSKINGGRGRKPKPLERPEALRPPELRQVIGQADDVDDVRKFLERKNGR